MGLAALACFFFLMVTGTRAFKVLVTGANKGIGRAICEKLLSEYPETEVYLGSRDAARGKAACAEIERTSGASGRLHLVELDVEDDASVRRAADSVGALDGFVANAGVGFGNGFEKTIGTNFFGTVRVCEAFLPKMAAGGRVVTIASASGPNFVSRCRSPDHRGKLARPDMATIDEIKDLAQSYCELTDYDNDAYGVSKACVNAYTHLLAKANPTLVVNSVTPGYIDTDLTRGMGAPHPPAYGARIPVYLLMDPEVATFPTGRFYGSDGKRSPYDRYREPGSPPYDGPP